MPSVQAVFEFIYINKTGERRKINYKLGIGERLKKE